MWPFLNNVTTTCGCTHCTPSTSICYTGVNLSCIGVNKNDTLSVALQKINALMCVPITNTEIITALGYTPANDSNVVHKTGNETKNGTLIVNDTGDGYGVQGNSIDGTGVIGNSENGIGVEGNSLTNLAGQFDTLGTKIVSFLTNSVEQAYILATGLFKANKILVNTTTDNGIDALQVNGTISATAASTANQVVIKSQLDAVRPYKVYTALLTQTGTNAPTAVVLENTIGTTISYSHTSPGNYNFIATGSPFSLNKTAVFISGQFLGVGFGTVTTASTTTVSQGIIGTQQSSGGVNDYLINTPIEIRVYN